MPINSLTSANDTCPSESPLYLMALNNTNENIEGYFLGRIYRFTEYQDSESGILLHDFVPVQRRSDGVCGLFDIVKQNFIEMSGTNITSSAAGPITEEY